MYQLNCFQELSDSDLALVIVVQVRTGLVSSMLSFEEREDLSPRARRVTVIRCGPPRPAPLALVRKHITDLLNVPRQVHASKIDAALSAPLLHNLSRFAPAGRLVAHANVALLAAKEEWQTATHQDG